MPEGHALPGGGAIANLELGVALAEPLGAETMIFSELGGVEIQARMHNPRPVASGETLLFELHIEKCHLFDAGTGRTMRDR